MSARKIWPELALTAFFLAACQPGDGDKDAKTDEDATPAIPVEIASATRGDIFAVYSGTAPIEAFTDATVIAKVAGEVREILVEEGDNVKGGDVLGRLDGDRLRLEMEQAGANLRKLKRDYQRKADLKDRGLISAGDFEKIQYEMEALQATYDLAALELGYTEIRAPIDGVISERFIKIGNTIEVNAPTFHVTSLEPLISYLHVPEREYRRIDPGQEASIFVDALAGEEFSAIVSRVSPVVDPDTGTFKISIEVTDPSRRLKPGMFGRINIIYDIHKNAMQIPRSAIVEEAGQSAIYVVADDVAERRVIRTGYAEGGQIEVLEGLDDAEVFVILGHTSLKNGSKVSIINAADSGEKAASTDSSST
jgi:membrane fusion protein (multidrug efflux system)